MYGKLIGAVVGAAVGLLLQWSPLLASGLALLGFVIGHLLLDREPSAPRIEAPPSIDELLSDEPVPRRTARRAAPPPRPRPPPATPATPDEDALAAALCPIFIEVARADAPVAQVEIRVVREFFQGVLGFGEAGMEAVRAALKAALAAGPADLDAAVLVARGAVKPAARLDVVRALYDMALSDGELKRSETDALKRVVQHFNLSDEQLQAVTKELFGQGAKHYQALGLTEAATDEEIKSAFRRLAAEHHPDRATALGPKEAEAAAERFRQIKDAYEELRKLRGL